MFITERKTNKQHFNLDYIDFSCTIFFFLSKEVKSILINFFIISTGEKVREMFLLELRFIRFKSLGIDIVF